MAPQKRNGYRVAVIGIAIVLIYAGFFGYYTRTRTFSLTYFPDNTYMPTKSLPNFDGRGEPKVVMVRRSGPIECFDVFYSHQLKQLLEAGSSGSASITYRVRYRFHSFWIETLDVAGLGIEPSTSPYGVRGAYRNGNVDPGDCF
jgi:hypothetical protein